MREYAAPAVAEVPTSGNLTDDVVSSAGETPGAVLFARRIRGQWHDVTAAEFAEDVQSVARGLMAAGVQPGDRVGLISKTRYEWTLFDYAIWWVGAATVPVYETSSADQIGWLLSDSGAVACVVETQDHRSRVEEASPGLPDLRNVWVIDGKAVENLAAAGGDVSEAALEERRSGVGPQHLATVVYTSGTTGSPKGCMLTHANFMCELTVAVDELSELFDEEGASTVLFLPLAHVFARILQVGCVKARVRMGHLPDVRNLVEELGEFQPTFLLVVPRVFEKIFTAASQQAHSEGRGRQFDTAASVAIEYSRALDRGRVNPLLRGRYALHERLVYDRLRTALGGKVRYAICGGAPLGDRLNHFFRGVGLTVLEGYGLTETTGALTVNTPSSLRIGSVGRPLGGTTVRVADDGELLFRGGQVFAGYWRAQQATHEAIDDGGWLHTGDVGEVDGDGFVHVTSRKREIIVTSGGKNVTPAALEEVVRAHPLVGQCMVVGEARPFVAALVTLDPESLPSWLERHGKRGDQKKLVDDSELRAEIQHAVDEANETVSHAESIRRFKILPTDWTEESGHLTPTQKLKRSAVLRDFASAVESLYR